MSEKPSTPLGLDAETLRQEFGLTGEEAEAALAGIAAIQGAMAASPRDRKISPAEADELLALGTPPAAGRPRFGRYLDPVEIGRGGMGRVLSGVDPELGRPVAIKVVSSGTGSGGELVRLIREARITGRLEHPSIPPVHELARTPDGEIYFAMKLISGRTLARAIGEIHSLPRGSDIALARRPLLAALLKVCDALAYAHSAGVVHRDLKPSNIMLGEFGEVLVMDWGIARIRGQWSVVSGQKQQEQKQEQRQAGGDPGLTEAGTILGTPAYMPPEQTFGEIDQVDERSDIYALGAVIFEILTLVPPPPARGLASVAPSIANPRGAIPPELDALVARAMAFDREHRYPTVQALRDDLEAHLSHRPLSVARYSIAQRIGKWIRRNPATGAVAAAAAVLLVAVSGGFLWRLEGRRREAEARALRDGDLLALRRLEREAQESLWPPYPDRIPDLERWTGKARELLDRRDDDREEDRLGTETQTDRRNLAELVAGLEALESALLPDVARRLSAARRLERLSRENEADWSAAILSIGDTASSPAYRGLSIRRAPGLTPIGRDPDSGLWEFAHLLSGDPPGRDERGRIEQAAGSGIVLVLVPGGTQLLGAERATPRNADPWAEENEGPRREENVLPFFLSKFEMTRGQWARCLGTAPGEDELLPVAGATWDEARHVLVRVGLDLPREVEWEAASRAGSETPWWTGENPLQVLGAANLADQALARSRTVEPGLFEDWLDDGFAGAAPVGTFRSNPWGLADTIGNVAEWCRDSTGRGSVYRACRGGSFLDAVAGARSASRDLVPPGLRGETVGIRPARSLE
ncbi:MAG: SUMF1/EgtB/PvdO family nonheme iron enzyme [Planctomycetes bacterium]|nr:SUMF1/EgtB/PvdO family nonheme iron enzyme [Planctomycetota bacterium]